MDPIKTPRKADDGKQRERERPQEQQSSWLETRIPYKVSRSLQALPCHLKGPHRACASEGGHGCPPSTESCSVWGRGARLYQELGFV